MLKQTVKERIRKVIAQQEAGTPIPYKVFEEAGSASSIQRVIRELCQEGDLLRLIRGFYVIPKAIPSLPGRTITCTPSCLAEAWAKDRGYILTSTGFEEEYLLRFQTQMPVKTQFWTNGPNKLFKIGHATALVKHVSKSMLRWHDIPLGRLYRALKNMDPDWVKEQEIDYALSLLYSDAKDKNRAILEMLGAAELEEWHHLLAQCRKANNDGI